MAGIIDNSGGIWSFRQKVALFEQALDQEGRELCAIANEADYQISNVAARLSQSASDCSREDAERQSAQRLLDDMEQALVSYRSAREEAFRLFGANPTGSNCQSAQAYLARLGQTLDEYYGLGSHSTDQSSVNEYVEVDAASGTDGSASGTTVDNSATQKTLRPDRDVWYRRGVAAVEQRVEAYKDDLRDKGYSESEVKSMGDAEYGRIMHDEFGPDFNHWGSSV